MDPVIGAMIGKSFDSLCEKIEELKNDLKKTNEKMIVESMNKNLSLSLLHTKIRNLEESINLMVLEQSMNSGKTPHKCPLCEGEGKRQYSLGVYFSASHDCGSCEGKGIVWG